MRVHKTWQNQRKTYTYVSLKGEKTVLRPGEDGVTEEMIHELHLADDREVENNLKHAKRPMTEKEKAEIQQWKAEHPGEKYHDTWMIALDAFVSDDDGDSTIDRDPAFEDKRATEFYNPSSNEAIDRLREIIRDLPPRQKMVLELYWFRGYSQKSTAEMMQCSSANVSKLFHAACEKIRTDDSLNKILFRRG